MSTNAARTIFRFADFELDTVAYELRRKGRRLRLPRQPMDLLLLLVERPQRTGVISGAAHCRLHS